MAAARLHVETGTREKMQRKGGGVDVFDTVLAMHLPLLLRPLKALLGAYIPEPVLIDLVLFRCLRLGALYIYFSGCESGLRRCRLRT
jgi:hypothetical protein